MKYYLLPLLSVLILSLSAPLQAQQEMPPANVVVADLSEGNSSPSSKMVGVLRFDHMSEVAAEREGLITKHYFDTGQTVKQGELLLELDSALIEKDISIARSRIAEVDAQVQKLSKALKRQESLKGKSLASQSAYENTLYDLQATRSQRVTLQRQLERLQVQLQQSKVKAPFDGLVLEKTKEQGDWLGHGDSLARLGSTSGVRAIIPVAERLIPFQKVGKQYEVTLPAINRTITGTFQGWVPFVEVRSKSAYMKIMLPYEKGMLEHMSTEVDIATAQPQKLLMIPRAALLQNSQASAVYTIDNDKAVTTEIEIISRDAEFIAAKSSALKAGMQVIVDGNDRLKPGQAVNVINK